MALACGVMAGCGNGGAAGEMTEGGATSDGTTIGDNQKAEEDDVYTFTDDLGREIVVTSHERVASLLGSYADMWVLAGGSLVAAPEDAFVDFDLSLPEDTVKLGETMRLSLELLLWNGIRRFWGRELSRLILMWHVLRIICACLKSLRISRGRRSAISSMGRV